MPTPKIHTQEGRRRIIAIDPGPVNNGVVIGTLYYSAIITAEVVTADNMTSEYLLPQLQKLLTSSDTVIIEYVTPRPRSVPGMWSQTLKIAEIIGVVTWLCQSVGATVVRQNPNVVKNAEKKFKDRHINDAYHHLLHFVNQMEKVTWRD